MKNFKLLLATTAILSTGAILANATDLPGLSGTTPLQVKAEIIKNIQFESVEPVDFGRIAGHFDQDGNSWSLSFFPDSSGNTNPSYNNVAFHDGGKAGKVCFTEIVQGATLESGLSVTVDDIGSIKDGGNKIAEYLGTGEDPDYIADGGVTEDGIRCIYVGGQLHWYNDEFAQAFTGHITANTTVTVIYASVNN